MDKNKVFVNAYHALRSGKDFGKDIAETGLSKEVLSVATKIARACSDEHEFINLLNDPKNDGLGSFAVQLTSKEMESIRGGLSPTTVVATCLMVGWLWGSRDRNGG